MPAGRYPTEISRVSRPGRGQTFRTPDGAFLAPGVPVLDAPPAAPPVPPLAAAGPAIAGGGSGALGVWGLVGVVVGVGAGYWATHWNKPMPKLKKYRQFSANPDSWYPSDTAPLVPASVGQPGWYNPYYTHIGCDTAGFWYAVGMLGPTLGGMAPEPGQTRPCGQVTGFSTTWQTTPKAAFELGYAQAPNVVPQSITGVKKLTGTSSSYAEEWYRNGVSPGTGYAAIDAAWSLNRPGIAVPEVHWPSDEPELAPILWPANPFPRKVREAFDDAPYPHEVPEPGPVELPLDGGLGVFPVILVPVPTPGVDPVTDPSPGTGPVPPPEPPVVVPDQVITATDQYYRTSTAAQGGGRFGRPAGGSVDTPPRSREKERKTNVRSNFPHLWPFLNALTEGNEFIDDLWRALPKWARTKRYHNGRRVRANAGEKLADLYRHWDSADVPAMVANVFNDQLSDLYYAVFGRVQTAATRRMFRETGLGNFVGRGIHGLRYTPAGRYVRPPSPVPQISGDNVEWWWGVVSSPFS